MPLARQDLTDLVINDAVRLQNDPALMLAIADVESGFNPKAVSPTGVRGLFQVTIPTGRPYGQTPETRTDPRVSSEAGQRHFKDLLFKAGGDVPTALRWYNPSDPQYAQKVLARYATHQAALTQEPSVDALITAVDGTPAAPAAPSVPTPEPSVEDLIRAVDGTPAPRAPTPAAQAPATPGAPVKLDAQPLAWLPGFEFMHVLPEAGKQQVAEAVPGVVRSGINAAPMGAAAVVGAVTKSPTLAAGTESLLNPLAHEVNVQLGLEERGAPWFSVAGYPVDTSTLLGATAPWVLPLAQQAVSWSRAGKALHAADKATLEELEKAQQEYNALWTEYRANRITYGQAVAGQQRAVERLRQLPGRYGPETPSSVLYQKLSDVAGEALVDAAPAQALAAELRGQIEQYGQKVSPTVLGVLQEIEQLPLTVDVNHVHSLLKKLGPLTSKGDGASRGLSTRLMSGLHDTLEASTSQLPETAAASELLYAARGSFRKEKAVEEMQRLFRPGGPIVKYDDAGRLVVNTKALQNQMANRLHPQEYPLFAGSFSPEELDALQGDIRGFVGTPKIPSRVPAAPGPFSAPAPQAPHLEPLTLNRFLKEGGALGGLGYGLHLLGLHPSPAVARTIAVGVPVADVVSQGLAKLMLTPNGRQYLRAALQADGSLDPGIYPVLQALGAPQQIDQAVRTETAR